MIKILMIRWFNQLYDMIWIRTQNLAVLTTLSFFLRLEPRYNISSIIWNNWPPTSTGSHICSYLWKQRKSAWHNWCTQIQQTDREVLKMWCLRNNRRPWSSYNTSSSTWVCSFYSFLYPSFACRILNVREENSCYSVKH